MDTKEVFERILAGETASIENTDSAVVFISLTCDNGSHLEIELAPGQAINFSSGDGNAELILHRGDPAKLLVIKPESAS